MEPGYFSGADRLAENRRPQHFFGEIINWLRWRGGGD